jgi:hypothetical protein
MRSWAWVCLYIKNDAEPFYLIERNRNKWFSRLRIATIIRLEWGENMNKTKKLIAGVSSASVAVMLSGCNDNQAQELPPEPTDTECQDWEWDEDDGVYECDDTNSRFFGYYFFGGRYFSGTSSLLKNSKYKAYKNSSSFKGGSTGFGSNKGFGG